MITITIIGHDHLLWELHKNIHMANTFNTLCCSHICVKVTPSTVYKWEWLVVYQTLKTTLVQTRWAGPIPTLSLCQDLCGCVIGWSGSPWNGSSANYTWTTFFAWFVHCLYLIFKVNGNLPSGGSHLGKLADIAGETKGRLEQFPCGVLL